MGGKNNMVNGWKITAIIFMVVFILQSVGIGLFLYMGLEAANREERCALDVCEGDLIFAYDYSTKICECWNWDNELIKTEYIE